MDFDLIFLSKAEMKRLKALAKSGSYLIDTKEDTALINHRLVSHERILMDDSGTRRFHCRINDTGKLYLAYVARNQRNKRSDRHHNWIIALFTTAAGAVLSRPLWQILDWIIDLLNALP